VDWSALFGFDVSPLELVVRGTLLYVFLLLIFRFILHRDLGSMGVPDMLFIVIVADAAQNGLAGAYDSVSEAFVLVGTLVAWNYALDLLSYRFALVRWLTEAPPRLLVRRGRVVAHNLRREHLTRQDLHAQLRLAGVSSLADVRAAFMEGDGRLSVITYSRRKAPSPEED
jgi:uncharacterized membrane protein YcaP (DUF421 family)